MSHRRRRWRLTAVLWRRSRVLVLALLLGGCGGTAPSPSATGGALTAAPTASASSPATAAPTSLPTPATSPTGSASVAERVPEWLAGQPYVLWTNQDATSQVLGRFGMPGRLEMEPGERAIAAVGDRVITLTNIERQAPAMRFAVWSFATGERVAGPFELPGYAELGAYLAGEEVLLLAGSSRMASARGVLAVSSVDGAARWLVAPGPEGSARTRVLALGESPARFGTQVCLNGIESPYDCGRLEIRRVADGTLVETVAALGHPIERFTLDWMLARQYGFTGILDRSGNELWSSRDLGPEVDVGFAKPIGQALVAEVSGIGADHEPRLLRFDIRTGRHDLLLDPPAGSRWAFITGLSTDRYLVIGDGETSPCGITTGGCLPEDPDTFRADVLDLETGELLEDAIHVSFAD